MFTLFFGYSALFFVVFHKLLEAVSILQWRCIPVIVISVFLMVLADSVHHLCTSTVLMYWTVWCWLRRLGPLHFFLGASRILWPLYVCAGVWSLTNSRQWSTPSSWCCHVCCIAVRNSRMTAPLLMQWWSKLWMWSLWCTVSVRHKTHTLTIMHCSC